MNIRPRGSMNQMTIRMWSAEAGEFSILVGSSSDNIRLRDKFTLTR